jgi:hypothetical protein
MTRQTRKIIVASKGQAIGNFNSPEPIHAIDLPEVTRITVNIKDNQLYASTPSSLYIINGLTNLIAQNLTVDKYSKMAYDNTTNQLLLINGQLGLFYSLDGNAGKILRKIQLDHTNPTDITVNPNTELLFFLYAFVARRFSLFFFGFLYR